MSRPHTGTRPGEDGRFLCWCRICPRRQWRNLPRHQRANVWFDTIDEAREQGRRHRQSEFHQGVVVQMAKTDPTAQEVALAEAFGVHASQPCEDCDTHHAPKLSCLEARRIRTKEHL